MSGHDLQALAANDAADFCRVGDPGNARLLRERMNARQREGGATEADAERNVSEALALVQQVDDPCVRLSDVEPEPVSWLWSGKIPLAKLSIIEGDPGVGKTTLTLDLAARASSGRAMPGDESPLHAACGVLVASAEDGLADTLRPRLEAAGADLTRVLGFKMERLPDLSVDGMETIENAIRRIDAKLVVLDPLAAFIPDKVDSHRDHHVRRLLTPLAALAQTTGAAVVAVRHLSKGSGSAKHRGNGSIGVTGAARSVLLAASAPKKPDGDGPEGGNDSLFVLARTKGNLAPPWPSITYRLEPKGGSVAVVWGGTIASTADELLSPRPNDGAADDRDTRHALADARDFLRELLSDGWHSTDSIRRTAAEAGIAWRTIERAKAHFGGVRAVKSSGNTWGWQLLCRPASEVTAGTEPVSVSTSRLNAPAA